MNCLDLFAQIKVPLHLIHLFSDAAADLLLNAHDIKLMQQYLIEVFEARAHVEEGKDFLPNVVSEIEMACDDVCQPPRILHDGDGYKRFRREFVRDLYPLFELIRNTVRKCFHILGDRCALFFLIL